MFDFDDPKNWSALIIGLLLMALGIIPMLQQFKIITWATFLTGNWLITIAPYLLAAGGIYLLIDSFMEDDTMRIVSILVSLVVIAVGVIDVLNKFKIIGFGIPFLEGSLGTIIYLSLFILEGLFLFIAAFAMF